MKEATAGREIIIANTEWMYGRPLHLFKTVGATKRAASLLRKAIEQNPHVPAYLLGTKKLPKSIPDYVSWGEDSEAVVYVDASCIDAQWRSARSTLASIGSSYSGGISIRA